MYSWIPILSLPNVNLSPLSYLSSIKATLIVFLAFPVHYDTHLPSPCRTDPSPLSFAPNFSVNLCTNQSFHRYRCYYEIYLIELTGNDNCYLDYIWEQGSQVMVTQGSKCKIRRLMSSLEKNTGLFDILKASRESLPIKASSIFVNALTSFMGKITRCAINLICKHIEAIRSYAFFAGQQRSNKTKIRYFQSKYSHS